MLKATNIYKSYEDVKVLSGVNLEIEKAEFTCIVGKSGSGKSTLLHILGSIDKPTKGEVFINGTNLFEMSEAELSNFRNRNIGFVFQFHHLLKEFTALENVMIPGQIRKTDLGKLESKAKELLDYLGLADRLTHKPAELSGGEQQRVAIARALINDPLVVFADEPTGNLDMSTSEELHNLFFKLRKDLNKSFVIVTHNEELARISDRRLEMVDGVLIN
jgi:lipoprotein-releasing system ATP-binding protein